MVLDTSAILAMLFDEPEAEAFEGAVVRDPTRLMSAPTLLETAVVVTSRLGDAGERELDLWLYKATVDVVPFTHDHVEVARLAYRSWGKGRHPAALNYGDCFSYALSKASGEPLLFKGNDFALTDVQACLVSAP